MKRCTGCGVEKPRTTEFFYFSRRGYPMSDCKPCSASRARLWERTNNVAHLAIRRAWSVRNPERSQEVNAAWIARNRAAHRLMQRASQAVFRAIRKGLLIRASTCEQCGSGGRIEAAHKNYVDLLDVRWLCRSCHRRWDKAEPKSRVA